jgi:malonate-semialdehyde dehydrogenase (acetylating)/methylmalonate-semialdehyde dehydrogenase
MTTQAPFRVSIPAAAIDCFNFYGSYQRPGRGPHFSVVSPYNGQVIGHLRQSTMEDVHEVIQVALKAQKSWQEMSLRDRCQIMFRFRELTLQELPELIHLTSAESGKTLEESKAEWLKGLEIVEYASSLENLPLQQVMEVSRGVTCEMKRKALGLVVGITPFNFPAMVPLWMIPIALTMGNAFIWKPSDKTPLSSTNICRLFQKAGLPDGLLTTIHGGALTAESLIIHPEIKAIGFVGSTAIAKTVYQLATHHHKRALALGGAKNHLFLLPDADPEMATDAIVDSFTGCAGQRCMAASVLLTVGDCSDYWPILLKKIEKKVLGQHMGALISAQALNFLQQTLLQAQQEQTLFHLDGRTFNKPYEIYGQGGFWLGPSVLTIKPDQHYLSQTELFGPILSHIPCPDISSAIAQQQRSPYGNAVGILTSSGPLAEHIIRHSHAGMIGVNVGVPVPREPFSFGGVGASKIGHGDITGESAVNFWTDLIKITKKWAPQKDKNWMN